MDIVCPNCGADVGFDVEESFKGNVSCCWCPNTYYVEVEKGDIKIIRELKEVKQESQKK